MEFLKQKFFDTNNYIDKFLDKDGSLLKLEGKIGDASILGDEIKKAFVQQFIDNLVSKKIISLETINSVSNLNAWSIDFPSWHGAFNEERGKNFLIIGAEPHIHHKYLQTVYGFNNGRKIEEHLDKGHQIFRFISEILSYKYKIPKEAVLQECYLTDLFPLSPYRGNGKKVGTAADIQKVIGTKDSWSNIRHQFAKISLPFEVKSVKPKLIIAQGKQVFEEIIKVLGIEEKRIKIDIIPHKGRKEYIRSVNWNDTLVVSVPHIGSRRMRTFWNNNIDRIREAVDAVIPNS